MLAALPLACGEDGSKSNPLDGFVLEDSYEVAGGDYFAIKIAATGELVPDEIVDPYDQLSEVTASAVDRAPSWITEQLARHLAQLPTADADTLAEQILAAEDLMVDEVAWSIAVTDAPILSNIVANSSASLFLENAEGVYAMAGQLAYADLVEVTDGLTTLLLNGENGEFQLDPEQYYWYVVHPRSYMELPRYVQGYFWRTLFLEDDIYGENLVDAASGAQTIQEAADLIGDWMQAFMSFQYGTNDLQPVQIYYATIGSCGQYTHLTNAAARAVLIPSVTASARADDHEWNEIWDERWVHYDTSLGDMPNDNPHYPYIDWPDIYDVDIGSSSVLGEVSHVLRFRPDQNIFPSDLYTQYLEVTIAVTDAAGEPVEGVRVQAHTVESSGGYCTWEYTDDMGEATLYLGDDLLYTFIANAEHLDLGTATALASGTGLWIYEDSEEPVLDAMSLPLAYERTVTAVGDSPGGGIKVALGFEVTETRQYRSNMITEGYEIGDTYEVTLEGGALDVFVTNAAGYDAFENGQPFDAWAVTLGQSQAALELAIPPGEDWYVVLDNSLRPNGDKQVSVSLITGDQQ
jgi:hypothetical protein